ncbi:MAG: YvcK family protein [Candidatus Levybacteria bacterium]|nr:YvcK family protein [Candidatus Levybacteria bacterium]
MATRVKNIACLGGGIGTSKLLRGLKAYDFSLSAITSMADDGGSSGRLREAYNIMPPGDIVSCIAALIPEEDKELEALLLHRFPGKDTHNKAIDGHKLGNLIMLAEIQRTGNFYKAIDVTKRMFGVTANLLPATDERVDLWAITNDNRRVYSETTLDLALYSEPRGLKKVYITPSKPLVNKAVIKTLREADVIISGPGDLYTNQLPVLIVPEIKDILLQSKARKIFILNIANKPFETKNFALSDYMTAIKDHLGEFPFDTIIANNDIKKKFPKDLHYQYVRVDKQASQKIAQTTIIEADVVYDDFPIYHNPKKLAEVVMKAL